MYYNFIDTSSFLQNQSVYLFCKASLRQQNTLINYKLNPPTEIMQRRIILLMLFIALSFASSFGQSNSVTVSGLLKDKTDKAALAYVNVVLKTEKDNAFVTGTVSDEDGRFTLSDIAPNDYYLEISFVGYTTLKHPLFIGSLSEFLDITTLELEQDATALDEVIITGQQDGVSSRMDKQTYSLEDNISQSGGSVLQSMQNLPGVTIQEGQVQLRGNDRVTILIDGKQTAITGFGNQSGLDNIPGSAVERIEIINNPSARYDANGNAGIINIILKKEKQEGFNGKVGLTTGLGALWIRQENLPTIRPQYHATPKINPSLSLNYRKDKVNIFLQADNLYTQTLNKNEFVTRTYDDGTVINHQLKRNRNTNFLTSKAGIDWFINDNNSLTISALYGRETIIDRGDQPFFNEDMSERLRLWQFLEDEVLTTTMLSAAYRYQFKEPGHNLNIGFNYTFHREDEKYFFDNTLPSYTDKDSFMLIADEHVSDFNLDYVRPLKHGRFESGLKFRRRTIPTNMEFFPGLHSPLDPDADGDAVYKETIPAAYGNYIYETRKLEAEIGLRLEYVNLQYDVDPNHNTYKSDGYDYTHLFPNARITFNINDRNKLSAFYNKRVDRPDEGDIRIFPKYDDAEIIKVGNPSLRPQYTSSFELGYRTSWNKGYLYSAAYHRFSDGTITRISSIVPNSTLIYAISQNAGKSYNTGLEMVLTQDIVHWYSFNLNLNGYRNQINAFTVENLYPTPHTFSADKQDLLSGNIKLNNIFQLTGSVEAQLTAIYLAPDIIPQGRIDSRFSIDLGVKKAIQNGKGELFFNASDLLNTMVIKKEIDGQGFRYTSNDYYETQVFRLGYSYKF